MVLCLFKLRYIRKKYFGMYFIFNVKVYEYIELQHKFC